MTEDRTTIQTVPCFPTLEPCATCDELDLPYRLPFRPLVTARNNRQVVPVEVPLHFRRSRCAGPLSLGNLVYSNTLLPGVKVRLFTSDRHSRFMFDSETSLSYRQETTSEDQPVGEISGVPLLSERGRGACATNPITPLRCCSAAGWRRIFRHPAQNKND